MKTKHLFLFAAVMAGLALIPAGRVTAQTFTTLYSFTEGHTNSSGVYTNSDGAGSYAGLITNSSGNTLYGTARVGGSSGHGTVFAVHTDGTGFTTLHSFAATSGPNNTNSDGYNPLAGLILSGNTLYGTASQGGSAGNGTVFALKTDGSGFINLHSFMAFAGCYPCTNTDGANPRAVLVLSGNTLYGTAGYGGIAGNSTGNGTVFSLSFQPQLAITPSGTNVILSWPTLFNGSTLQSTPQLSTSNVWTSIPGPEGCNRDRGRTPMERREPRRAHSGRNWGIYDARLP